MSIWDRRKPSFGFISTRFAGLDGVSLETKKWAEMLVSKASLVISHKAGDEGRDYLRLAQMAEKNYMLGWRYLSYEMLEEKIE